MLSRCSAQLFVFLCPVWQCPGVTVEMAAEPSHEDVTKTATEKIMTLISNELVPTDEGYTLNLAHLFETHWCTGDRHVGFRTTLDTWEQRLRGLGHSVMSVDRLLIVPVGQVQEFHLAPWQLSWDAAVSVKGLAWRCQLSLPVSRALVPAFHLMHASCPALVISNCMTLLFSRARPGATRMTLHC